MLRCFHLSHLLSCNISTPFTINQVEFAIILLLLLFSSCCFNGFHLIFSFCPGFQIAQRTMRADRSVNRCWWAPRRWKFAIRDVGFSAGWFVNYKFSRTEKRDKSRVFIWWHTIMTICDIKLIEIVFLSPLSDAFCAVIFVVFLHPIDDNSFCDLSGEVQPKWFSVTLKNKQRHLCLMIWRWKKRFAEINLDVSQQRTRCILRWHFWLSGLTWEQLNLILFQLDFFPHKIA